MNILIYNQTSVLDNKAGSEVLTHCIAKAVGALGHTCHVITRGNYTKKIQYDSVHYSKVRRQSFDKFKNFIHDREFERFVIEMLTELDIDQVILCSFKNFPLSLLKKIKSTGVQIKFLVLDYNSICPSIKVFNNFEKEICNEFTDHNRCFKCQINGSAKLKPVSSLSKFIFRIGLLLQIPYFRYYRSRIKINKEFLSTVDAFIFSNKVAQKTISKHIHPRKSVVLEFPALESHRTFSKKIYQSITNFGFIGSAIPEKGLLELVSAFPSRRDNSLTVYTKVLNGQYGRRVSNIMQDKGLILNGEFAYKNISDIFKSLHILVIPSLWVENLPLVFMDALAFGTPVIVSKNSSLASIVDENGYGWTYEDSSELTELIENISANFSSIQKKTKNIEEKFRPNNYNEYVLNILRI